MKELPLFFYRPDDFVIFEKIENDNYVLQDNLLRSHRHEYSYECLCSHNFIPCTESEFPLLKENHDQWMEYMKWYTRSDGHGGSKGGSFDEFLKFKNTL